MAAGKTGTGFWHIERSRALAIAVGLVFAVGIAALRVADPAPLRLARELVFDGYQRLDPRPYTPQPVRIVDIDEASLRALGQWPWPRSQLARLTERLADLGAAAIAFDVVFPEPDRLSPTAIMRAPGVSAALGEQTAADVAGRLPDTDRMFAEAIKGRPVVLGFAGRDAPDGHHPKAKAGFSYTGTDPLPVLPPLRSAVVSIPELDEAAAGLGAINISPQDDEGIMRNLAVVWSDGKTYLPSLALEALRVAQGESTIVLDATPDPPPAMTDVRVGAIEWPTTAMGDMRLRYTHDVPDRYISAVRVLQGDDEELKPLIEGNIVFVGTTAAGLLDMRVTPLRETVPGVSIHAQAVEQILTGDHLERPDWSEALETYIAFAMALAVTLAAVLAGPLTAFLVGGLLAAALIVGSWLAFEKLGLLLDPIYAVGMGLALHFALTTFRYLVTDRDKRFVRRAFGRYVSSSVLAQLERDPGALRLGGEERELTILFMDIRGFTTISHSLAPTKLVEFLNRLLGKLSEDIVAEQGAIDKYIGDSIMAFWNAPLDVPDHPRRACLAALRMRESLAAMNAADVFGLNAEGRGLVVRIGVGLNVGSACVGNVGSQERFNYSAVGDAVNVAARIESLCKDFAFDLLGSDSMVAAVPDFAWLEGGSVELRGRTGETGVFALVGDAVVAQTPTFKQLAARHAELLRAAREGDDGAFQGALADCLARVADLPGLDEFYQALPRRLAPGTAASRKAAEHA